MRQECIGTHEPPFVERHVHEGVLETVGSRTFIEPEDATVPDAFAKKSNIG